MFWTMHETRMKVASMHETCMKFTFMHEMYWNMHGTYMKVAFMHEMCWNMHVSGAPFRVGQSSHESLSVICMLLKNQLSSKSEITNNFKS